MAKQCKLIKEIIPTTKQWTVKVIVAEKTMPRTSQHSPSKYQRLILLDQEGTRIQASIFGDDIELFRDTLSISKNYYISNAYVKQIKPEHRIVQNDYQWTINRRTLVQEVENDELVVSSAFSFVAFADLHKYMDCIAHVDVIALAIDMLPTRQLTTKHGLSMIQEVILINQEFKPIILTMWDQFVGNEATTISDLIETRPVIIAARLKVVSYNGMSLSTKKSSSFIVNPNISEATTLHSWFKDNESEVKDVINKKSYLASTSSTTIPPIEDVMEIAKIESSMMKRTSFWVKASIMVTNFNQNFWYMSCDQCHKVTGAEYGESFSCIHCKRKEVIATPRCRLEVELHDASGSIVATLFGQNAETFLSCSAKQLMDQTTEEGIQGIETFATLHDPKIFYVHIKASTFQKRGKMKNMFNIVTIHDAKT